MILIKPHFCWRRSLRGHDCQLTWELDPGNWRLLTPSPDLGRYNLPTDHTVGTIFKDTASREQCVVETIRHWSQLRPLYKLLILVGRYGDILVLWPPKTSLVSSLAYWTCHLSGVACLFLQSPLAFCVWGPVSDFTQGSSQGFEPTIFCSWQLTKIWMSISEC